MVFNPSAWNVSPIGWSWLIFDLVVDALDLALQAADILCGNPVRVLLK